MADPVQSAEQILTLEEVEELCRSALIGAGAADHAAAVVAQSVRDGEADGIRAIALEYMPIYCRHLRIGKVVGDAKPTIRDAGSAGLMVDAAHGFSHAAFAHAEDRFYALAHEAGVAAMGLTRSYASAVIGWFSARITNAGLVGLTVTNASPTVAPFGGYRPVFGTNPIALGVPRSGQAPLVIDTSPAATTRLAVKAHHHAGEAIPEGWGLDSEGNPCTDPSLVLKDGSIAPASGHKGSALMLMIEILAAGLTGANWSFEASDLGNDAGGPPGIGQFFIAISPERFAGPGFSRHLDALIDAIVSQNGTRLPGDKRLAHRREAALNGVSVPTQLITEIRSFAS